MIKSSLFYLLALLLLVSCNKERNIHVKALNPVTNEPYSDLRVVITSSKTGFNGEVVKTVYDGNLNSDGEAMINLKIKKNRSYAIRCEQPPNTCYTKELQYYYTVHDEENPSFLFEYAECGYLKIHVDNIDCQGANDRILFDFEPTYIDNYSNIIPREEFGCYSNEFISSKVPYGSWQATWEVTKNGNTTYYDSLFYINEGEEYVFEINY